MKRKWDIDKNGLTVAYWDVPIERESLKFVPFKVYESPHGDRCVFVYGNSDPNNSVDLSNFVILEGPYAPRQVLKTDNSSIYCWRTPAMVSWSPEGTLVSITVMPKLKNKPGYHEAKLLVDIPNNKFTLVLLAGATSYLAEFLPRNLFGIRHVDYGARDHHVIEHKQTPLSHFVWRGVEEFPLIVPFIERGVFGDITGYLPSDRNIHFKSSQPAWPYVQR